jgi:hypothetical protein
MLEGYLQYLQIAGHLLIVSSRARPTCPSAIGEKSRFRAQPAVAWSFGQLCLRVPERYFELLATSTFIGLYKAGW